MRNKNNLLFHTFIGLEVEIINSSDFALIGLKGKIVDETKNLFVIENSNKEKKIPKIPSTFRFLLDDGSFVDIEGKKIAFRPSERPKKIKL
ncbi:MAG TPA: ribonuclease P protein component 1 [Candidatus Bilamarchaeaceae archaeon]|nr:ribonuclease P protein component 1 [Candidatus Bilamarchaeaceae archaeon]